MCEMNASGRAAEPAHALWYSMFQALDNERCLDLRYRATRTNLRDSDAVPNYKVMKQLVLRNRLGPLYRPFIAFALVLIPVLAVLQWLLSIFVATTRGGAGGGATLHIVPTTPVNMGLIEAALSADPTLKGCSWDSDSLAFGRLCREIGFRGVLHCIASHARLLRHILRADRGRRSDLLLHSRDIFTLIMLVRYVQRHPDHTFISDDHYQRWAFLLSHYCEDFRIVQHGFLDSNIRFPHSFGIVQTVYVRDKAFVSAFAAYYQIREGVVFSPVTHFTPTPLSGEGLFLASSFPSIDGEIDFVKLVKARRNVPVVVKFHPAHSYDARKHELASLASYICSADDYPACRIFVSYNSFMEFDYRAVGIPTFSIARLGGPAETAQAICSLLDQWLPKDNLADPISIASAV